MFVHYLNERQQGILLHYADEMMRVDSSVDADELVHMDVIRKQAEPGVKAEDVPANTLPDVFEDRASRLAFLLELVGMGYVNENFDPRQSKLVNDIAGVFEVDERDLREIESWVKEQLSLVRRAHRMMED